MTDSTSVILPASRAFASGTLEMPDSITANYAESVQTWSSFPVNMVLVIIATLLMFLTIRIFLNIAPLLFDSLSRWKACVNIDASVQLKGDRNTLATIITLPIALVADRYGFSALTSWTGSRKPGAVRSRWVSSSSGSSSSTLPFISAT